MIIEYKTGIYTVIIPLADPLREKAMDLIITGKQMAGMRPLQNQKQRLCTRFQIDRTPETIDLINKFINAHALKQVSEWRS